MSETMEQNYQLLVKNVKDKTIQNIPVLVYLVMFLFTVLFEVVDVDFNIAVLITSAFWLKLPFSYVILIGVFLVLFSYFKSIYLEKERSLEVKRKANEISDEISKRRLKRTFKDYTRTRMSEMEKRFFEELLNDCGNIDTKYLGREYTIPIIRHDYKQQKLLTKTQFNLLKDIKNGKIRYHKLNGDEISYIGYYDVSRNSTYKNRQAEIISKEVGYKIVMTFVIAIAFELLLQSIKSEDGQITINLKEDWLKTLFKLFSVIFKYATATYFSYKTGCKAAEEQLRFTEAVMLFAEEFLETNPVPIIETSFTKEITKEDNPNG